MANTYLDFYNDSLGADNTFRERVASALTVQALFSMGQSPDAPTKALAARVFNDPDGMARKMALAIRSRLTSSQPFAADVTDDTIIGQVSVVFADWVVAGA